MCHVVPVVSAIVTTVLNKNKKNPDIGQLNLLFYGASIFGIVDHLWNGELFLISPNIGKDLLLGVVISACVLAGWAMGLYSRRRAEKKAALLLATR